MRNKILTFFLIVVLSIMFYFVGFFSDHFFMYTILPDIAPVKYIEYRMNARFLHIQYISLALASIPVIVFLVWKYSPVRNAARRVLSVICILIFMAGAVWGRIELVKFEAKHLAPEKYTDDSNPAHPVTREMVTGYPLDELHYGLYAFLGIAAGSFLAFFVLRQKK